MKQLIAEGICKSYGKQSVLEDLNLTIDEGKIYGLIGRNGTGKTTLLGILTAQNTLNAGSVTYCGAPVWENRDALRDICFSRELSATVMGGQNNMKIKYYLEAAAIFYPNWDKKYADALVQKFNLNPKKKIAQLSKGQMSLVTIIIALASRAPFTIFDEPVAGLDVVARDDFYALLLKDYEETNRTFIISTHIIEEAASIFEEVILLNDGKIIEKAPTDELVAQFHYVSGHEDAVRTACNGLEVLSTQQMGRQMVCAVRGAVGNLAIAQSLDVDIAPMNLQKVFLTLCGHNDEGTVGTL